MEGKYIYREVKKNDSNKGDIYIFALLIFININKIKTNFWGKNEKAIDIIKHLKNAFIIWNNNNSNMYNCISIFE